MRSPCGTVQVRHCLVIPVQWGKGHETAASVHQAEQPRVKASSAQGKGVPWSDLHKGVLELAASQMLPLTNNVY